MKNILILIIVCLPLFAMAQSEWERPLSATEKLELAKKAEAEAKKAKKEAIKAAKAEQKRLRNLQKKGMALNSEDLKNTEIRETKLAILKDKEYIKKDAVPEINGKIVFTLEIDIPGKSSQEIYDKIYSFLDKMSQESNQIKSGIALFNKKEHIVAAQYSEWLEFTHNFFILDQTEFNYTIIANCSKEHLKMTMERISYNYEEGRENGFKETAEKLISNKYALNKKGTKLIPISAKFRKKTIDRKNAIFKSVKQLF